MDEFDIIALVSNTLEHLDVPVIEGWYDELLSKTHITVHEYFESEEAFEDDEVSQINHNIQVDVWSKDSLESLKLKNKITKKLKEKGFLTKGNQNFYELDTKLYHGAMRFTYVEYI